MNHPPSLVPEGIDVALFAPIAVCFAVAVFLGVKEWRASARLLAPHLGRLLPILALGAFLRLTGIEARAPWYDEGLSAIRCAGLQVQPMAARVRAGAWLSDFDPFEAPGALSTAAFLLRPGLHNADVHPPFYFFLARLWLDVVGASFLSLRLFSVVLGIVAIALGASLALETFGDRGSALLAAALIALSPVLILYSQQVRMYSLVAVLTLGSSLALVRFLAHGQARQARLLAALTGLGCLTHGLFGPLVVGQCAFLLVARRLDRGRARAALFATLAGGACALPWLLVAVGLGRNQGIQWLLSGGGVEASLMTAASRLALVLVPILDAQSWAAVPAVMVLIGCACWSLRGPVAAGALAVPALAYVAVFVALDVVREARFGSRPRYFIVPGCLLLVLVAGAASRLVRRAGRPGVLVACAALGLLAVGSFSVARVPALSWEMPGVTPTLEAAWRATTPYPVLAVLQPLERAVPELVAWSAQTTVRVRVEPVPGRLAPSTFVWKWETGPLPPTTTPGSRFTKLAFHVYRLDDRTAASTAP